MQSGWSKKGAVIDKCFSNKISFQRFKTVLLGMEWSSENKNFMIPRDESDARFFYYPERNERRPAYDMIRLLCALYYMPAEGPAWGERRSLTVGNFSPRR